MFAKIHILCGMAKSPLCQDSWIRMDKFLTASAVISVYVSSKAKVLLCIFFLFTFALTISSNDCHLHFINLRRRDCV